MARAAKKPAKAKAVPARASKPARKASGKAPARVPPKVTKSGKVTRSAKVTKSPAKKAAPSKRTPPAAKAKVKAPPPKPPTPPKKAAPPAVVKVPKPIPVKPSPPVKVVPKKPRKPELTPREIATLKVALEKQREIFSREAQDIEEGTFNVSQSEMSGEVSFDEEYADAGSFTFEREKDLSIGNNIRDLLDKVNHALAAIQRKTYGICENCGDPIAKARLLALPYSTLCLKCKQQEERTR